MGYLYRPQIKKGSLPDGVKRCSDASHGKDDTCPGCGAQFGPHWWAKYYQGRRAIRENTHTGKITEAQRWLKAREGKVAAGERVNPRADRIMVGEILDDLLVDYRTNDKRNLDGVTRIVRRLKKAVGHLRAHNLTTADVRAYVAMLQAEPMANSTINRHLAALKRAFNLALADEKIHQKPHFPMLQEDNVRTGFLGEIEYLALHAVLPAPINYMLAFAYTYGWRKQEVLGLTWDRVDLQAGTVRLNPTSTDKGGEKNRRGRMVVLTDELRTLFAKLWDKTRALAERKGQQIPWVFHRDGEPVRYFRRAWATACRKAGVPGLVFHDLRRSAVRRMEQSGLSRSVAMAITGHRTESVYRRYAIVSEGDLHEAARRLSAESIPNAGSGTDTGKEAVNRSLVDFKHPGNLSE